MRGAHIPSLRLQTAPKLEDAGRNISKMMRKRLFLDFGCMRLGGFFLLDREQLVIGVKKVWQVSVHETEMEPIRYGCFQK